MPRKKKDPSAPKAERKPRAPKIVDVAPVVTAATADVPPAAEPVVVSDIPVAPAFGIAARRERAAQQDAAHAGLSGRGNAEG